MLLAVEWTPRGHVSDDDEKRTLARFTKWEPPKGIVFQGFYDYADGNGGLALTEAESAEALFEALAPWSNVFRFTARPLVPTEKSVPILQKVHAWRDSIG